jgi:hypothetical protein
MSLAATLAAKLPDVDESILRCFASVDRKAFLPATLHARAHEDTPLADESRTFHHSAPHMYAMVMKWLQLHKGVPVESKGPVDSRCRLRIGLLPCLASQVHQRSVDVAGYRAKWRRGSVFRQSPGCSPRCHHASEPNSCRHRQRILN